MTNWRPISLLNVDYKIATKAINNRIKKVLPNIISHEQSGFIKGRYIGENVRVIFDIIEHLEETNEPGLLFFADFAKAFDSLSHRYIVDCITSLNFGPNMVNWIKLFYNDIQSVIINNGHMSQSFRLQKGVRQGCPLSATLIIICLQSLSNHITLNEEIKGIKINNKEIKQTLFADDSTFFNNGDKHSFETLIKTLELFSKCSGLTLNTKKSTILRVGSLKQSNLQFCKSKQFIWTSDNAATLGMTFSNDMKRNTEINIDKKVKEFKSVLKQWQHRKLTLMGKVSVIKTFALLKLIYPFTVLANPNKSVIEEIKKYLFSFIWDEKPNKIKRDILYQKYEQAGLKLTNIEYFLNSLKAFFYETIY